MSGPVKVMITIDPCCDRLKYLSDILSQARSLNLSDAYQLAIENLILDIMPSVSAQDDQAIMNLYNTNITNILTLRDGAFNERMLSVRNLFVPIPLPPPS